MPNEKKLVTIVGPTGIGKTPISIEVAKHLNTEIISCDSRQFYKEMFIGTAVPSEQELKLVTHHFIQNISIEDYYSIGDFERDVLIKLDELYRKYDVVVMVGGSGLYVDAVTKGLNEFPQVDPSIRIKLNKQFNEQGILSIQKLLKRLDPKSYHTIDLKNPHRLIRALEICIGSDKPYSHYKNKIKKPRDFKNIKIGIDAERSLIYGRINMRVEKMIERGLMKEAFDLYEKREFNALQTVGYTEMFNYFEGNITFAQAINEIKKNTRRYAKRQNTWFKKDKDIKWFQYDSPVENILEFINQSIQI